MQRRNGTAQKRNYVKSGIPGHRAPGGRKANPARQIIKLFIGVVASLMILIVAILGISSAISNSGQPIRLNARPTDNIQAFGENVLYYDGMTLHCVGRNGASKWQFALGANADFYCTKTQVVAWTANQVHVLDKNGTALYNDRMSETIRFARVGDAYVAVCMGEDLNSSIRVTSLTGTLLENLTLSDLYVMDIGFFSPRGQLMWVLSLDINGTAPISNLQTYEPGKMSTGAVELNDEMLYRVYIHNNLLMAVDTSKIRAYNYKCVEQTDISSVLVYGWYVCDVRSVGKNTYALLEQVSSAGGSEFSELRVVNNHGSPAAMRLLSACFASGLGEKGVYGFGSNVVYYAPYGTNQFKTTYLTYGISDLICILDGDRAVMVSASGDDVFLMKLPN